MSTASRTHRHTTIDDAPAKRSWPRRVARRGGQAVAVLLVLALGARLRERVYVEAVPTLATALARRQPGADLDDIYEQALVTLFRLLFVAYGEDKDLLPYRTNGRYQHQALKTMALPELS